MSQVLQPLGSHHLLLVVPRYTFIKLFLLHLRPAILLRVHNLFSAERGDARCACWPVHVRSCMCGSDSEEGELGEVTLLFRSFRMLITPRRAKQLVRARAQAHAYQRWCWQPSRGVRRTPLLGSRRKELRAIAPSVARPL